MYNVNLELNELDFDFKRTKRKFKSDIMKK